LDLLEVEGLQGFGETVAKVALLHYEGCGRVRTIKEAMD